MSPRRLFSVLRLDASHNARRAIFWIWILLLILLVWGFSTGSVRIQSGNSAVGGEKAHITSEFANAQFLAILTALIYGFFGAVIAGMTVIHDDESRVGELLHTTPLRPSEYIWGKFLAVMVSISAVLVIHLLSTMFFNHVLPPGSAREFRGAFAPGNYIRPAMLFTLPTVLFIAGVSFAIGESTRRPILVYFLPVAILLACSFFLWRWSPSWLDPRIDKALMVVDPAGFRWLRETWLKVDRGVKFYNTSSIPLDGVFIANRLLFIGLGLGAVAFAQRHFTSSLRGASKSAERAWSSKRAAASAAVEPRNWPLGQAGSGDRTRKGIAASTSLDELIPSVPQRPLAGIGMTSRRPGLFAGLWTVARAELAELMSSPGLYLFVPLLVLEALGPNLIAVGAFDTPLLWTSGTFADRSMSPLTIMVCLLLLFYTGESFLRERNTRLAAISLATPVRTGSLLLGKALANSFVGVVVVVLQFLTSAVLILYQGKVGVELKPFGLLWGLLLIPTLFLWSTFVLAVLSLTGNRYVTYAVALAVLCFTGYRQIIGQINWVGNWALWGAVRWSDISVLEMDRSALWLNRIFALSLAVFFAALTTRFFRRREVDAVRLMHRLRPIPLGLTALRLSPFALVPLVAGAVLWARVENGFQGDATKQLGKNYWRKNLATYRDWPLPEPTAVDVEVDLDPARSHLKVSGVYELVNRRDKPIRQIPVTGGLHWKSIGWTLDKKAFTPENRENLYIFHLPDPLAPGASLSLGFSFEGSLPMGISKAGGGVGEFIVPSGVVLTSFGTNFSPVIGYQEGVGVDEENKYESKEYPDDFYKGQTDSFVGNRSPFKTRIKITGPADFRLNSVGAITSDGVENGRRTTVWESDQPVNFFNVVAGRWDVRKGKDTAVYFHNKHKYNVDEMVEALNAARQYYSEWFHPYPWRELKLSEFPSLADYAQGFPTDITFSESIGFLTKSDPRANAAFMVTAHESAHQWWGNILAPGKGPGGNILSEGTSHFSTLLLFDQVKGLNARIEFSKRIEDSYAKSRRADSERPLVKIDGTQDGDTSVTYDKSGMVFWMLLNHMGRERMLKGVRAFFQAYHGNPDHPVLQDFLESMRPFASDPAAFDAFTHQWFFQVVLPEYRFVDATRVRDGSGWKTSGKLENVGTGLMKVEIAAIKGARFETDGKSDPNYREVRTTVELGAHQSKEFTVRGDFEPDSVVVDPDVKVLQLQRKLAVTKL
jgi:ABC-2 type transport system permease protein